MIGTLAANPVFISENMAATRIYRLKLHFLCTTYHTTLKRKDIAGTMIFESLNVAYPFTILAKIAVATGVMEVLGNTTFEFYRNGGTL